MFRHKGTNPPNKPADRDTKLPKDKPQDFHHRGKENSDRNEYCVPRISGVEELKAKNNKGIELS